MSHTRNLLGTLGLVALAAAIWVGGPMTGNDLLASPRNRAILIAFAAALILGLRLWTALRRRRRARALERSLMPDARGDGAALASGMQAALEKLKQTGGKHYLYDLPWYIIIGPPGAGKTTALRNSGIGFPGLDSIQDHARGFGGTRNVDWWFAEDAVLIDTAGRYTTQDSDAAADGESWSTFLTLLKRGRPKQPINGAILAFSVQDMIEATPETLAAHAATVRARLAELHETFGVDVPVYVLFTKADLIAGFRDYFAEFGPEQRKAVWGATFQTRDPKTATHTQVGAEFDILLQRLSDELPDRLASETDPQTRIAMFGLPAQMAMLRDTVDTFLGRIFAPSRYRRGAILRGFYFTSGTQEGTPIDQVLGAMAQSGPRTEAATGFMSGKGKSFFLHDLLRGVIFQERGWLGYDRRAARRGRLLRGAALGVVAIATLAAMGAFGQAFWQSATLIRGTESRAVTYAASAHDALAQSVIDDPDPAPILPHLDALRAVAPGATDNTPPGLGLSRRPELALAADTAYSDGLERLLRPRMILALENALPQLVADGETALIGPTLAAYLAVGGQGGGGSIGDAVLTDWFARDWREHGTTADPTRLLLHLEAMLSRDGDRTPTLAIDPKLVQQAREALDPERGAKP